METTGASGDRPLELIAAPSNLGLRPPSPGHEPGTWAAPAAFISAGLATALAPAHLVELARPRYDFEEQPGTRIRNGLTIREHAFELASAVETALSAGRFPVVLGGDCSLLLAAFWARDVMAAVASCTWTVIWISSIPATTTRSPGWGRPREWTWRSQRDAESRS